MNVTTTTFGDFRWVTTGAPVPPGYWITGVRLCYALTSPSSFIRQIQLTQMQNPPIAATTVLDDLMDQTDPGPVCVDSLDGPIDPEPGAISLRLRGFFSSTSDTIRVIAAGLYLMRIP